MYEFNNCKQEYDELWHKANVEMTLPHKEFQKWMEEHCCKCPAMSEICMADEYEAMCRS